MTGLAMEMYEVYHKIEASSCNKFSHPEDGGGIFYRNQENLHLRSYFTSFSE
jgi:hypothetical protein